MWDYERRRGYAEQPDSYDRLVSAALMVDEVTFVTLNYDDLFDRRVFIHGALESMGSYLGAGRNWALIKLHGSINWGRLVVNGPSSLAPTDPVLAQTYANLGDHIDLHDEIVLRAHAEIRDARVEGEHDVPLRLYYPALAAPLGAEDELVCPPEHVAYLKEVTGHYDPLDVLVIGYSGLDQEVMKLLSWGGRSIRSLTVVSDTDEHAKETALRMTKGVRVMPAPGQNEVTRISGGFTNFAQEGDLDGYIERIRDVAQSEDHRRASNPSYTT
jgi:hypothetical protein